MSHFSGSPLKYQKFVETGDDITPVYIIALDYD